MEFKSGHGTKQGKIRIANFSSSRNGRLDMAVAYRCISVMGLFPSATEFEDKYAGSGDVTTGTFVSLKLDVIQPIFLSKS
ncbi:hypothetical protein TNIN_186871 [Trichonephila inaurata madagascariensis]|uniref:Uncharacterized protein n=1 Tax=Trichonephila inaurata madagascariensis TaxID=2747483 RepID=A0A8X6MF59_9ARAC|nr:hypothetical protein TNIN_186871 [Trichonephila inaurata madagascariensis]